MTSTALRKLHPRCGLAVAAYPNEGTWRWVVDVTDHGGDLILDDGSIWRTIPSERERAAAVAKTSCLTIHHENRSSYLLALEGGPSLHVLFQGFATLGWTDHPASAQTAPVDLIS